MMVARLKKRDVEAERRVRAIEAIAATIEAIDGVAEIFYGTPFEWPRSRKFLFMAWHILENPEELMEGQDI